MPAPPAGVEEVVLQCKQVLGAARSQGVRERRRRRRQRHGGPTQKEGNTNPNAQTDEEWEWEQRQSGRSWAQLHDHKQYFCH